MHRETVGPRWEPRTIRAVCVMTKCHDESCKVHRSSSTKKNSGFGTESKIATHHKLRATYIPRWWHDVVLFHIASARRLNRTDQSKNSQQQQESDFHHDFWFVSVSIRRDERKDNVVKWVIQVEVEQGEKMRSRQRNRHYLSPSCDSPQLVHTQILLNWNSYLFFLVFCVTFAFRSSRGSA